MSKALVILMMLWATPAISASKGIWLAPGEIQSLPTSGAAWQDLLTTAQAALGTAQVSDQDSEHDVKTFACALAAVRLDDAALRTKATDALLAAIGTESPGRWLAVGRNLGAYVVAADVLGLYPDSDPMSNGSLVGAWIAQFLTRTLDWAPSVVLPAAVEDDMSGYPLICLRVVPKFKAGDPAPDDYVAWHEWARVQYRSGLRQRPCAECGRWLFPQEVCRHA